MPSGSDSLRAVLLSARKSSTDSRNGSENKVWHSLKSDANTTETLDPPGHYFPEKLAMSAGLLKFFFGLMMIGLGGVSIFMKIPLSGLGPGLWVGVIVSVSGFLGVCAARRPYVQIYVISFMSVSILSLAASGLLVILSASGWIREAHKPEIIIYDKETESEVYILGKILTARPSVLVTGSLVILGVIDVLLSLACVVMSSKESCGSHVGSYNSPFGIPEGHDRKDRLYRWLGQQKDFLHTIPRYQTKSIPTVSQFIPLSSSSSTATRNGQRYRSNIHSEDEKGSSVQSNSASSVVFIHPQIPEDQLNRDVSEARERRVISRDYGPYSLPSMLPPNNYNRNDYHTGAMFHVDYPPSSSMQTNDVKRRHTKRKKGKSKKKRLRQSDSNTKVLTDKQIENTYTGLDREIAESFICFAMEPAASERKSSINELIV